jgi:hypothetical protein
MFEEIRAKKKFLEKEEAAWEIWKILKRVYGPYAQASLASGLVANLCPEYRKMRKDRGLPT